MFHETRFVMMYHHQKMWLPPLAADQAPQRCGLEYKLREGISCKRVLDEEGANELCRFVYEL
ncbi:hypothetical protein HanXRQr2_Chr16g0757561 [Helianthus annuus]|uniref:Uncharacterized protein n=1 Tax=Helianthus annuus TaxID=4232 RepID=A0A9K3DUZ0_HELAN|nr:hypothetical protein HanXRQr2_Chr16g0757561 [Helianthus annuus]KAJ0821939.1 hypothetical protein HanPSC8_Chr16g0726081 [Helianthus annuus]